MRKLVVGLGLGLVLLASVIFLRTARFVSRQVTVELIPEIQVNTEQAAQSLSQALRFQTISHENPAQFPAEEFLAFHKFFAQAFPKVHATLAKEVVGEYSLLYTWKGRQDSLEPVLLMGHLDVVPVEPGTEQTWTYPAFEGLIAERYVWGRGAWDDKSSVVATLEAVELLLNQGFQPQRSLYLAFGHDEEIGGLKGAAEISALLRSRGVKLEYVLDEGGIVAEGMIPGISAPVSLIGIAEKGYLSLELTVESPGGHSSMPPPQSAIGILSAAIHRLEQSPLPARFAGATRQMYSYLGPEMPFLTRMIFANLWLFGGLLESRLAANPATNAQIRTTTAATIFEAGVKENVLPRKARAVVNFRILPGESVQIVIAYVKETVNAPRVHIQVWGELFSEPSRVSSTESPGFKTLERTIRQVFPRVVVAPYLVVGATDSRYYAELGADTYRFLPFIIRSEDLPRLHGVNERVSVEGFAQAVRFYVQLLRNSL